MLTRALKVVIGAVVIVVVVALLVIRGGLVPVNADTRPSGVERWAAMTALHAAVAREAAGLRDPLPENDSVMTAGVRIYHTHCAVCHGTSDGKPSFVAQGLYQVPPQFAKDDVTDDPVEDTYWKITHGIRLTGMPAYEKTLTAEERWAVASFLRHQDSLPPGAEAAWKALPSAATDTVGGPSVSSR